MTIDDETVWRAFDAAEAETKCWRVFNVDQGRMVFAARDRLSLVSLSGEVAMQEAAFERMDFKDRDQAETYIRWRAIKAALEAGVKV